MDTIQSTVRLHCFLIIDRFPGKLSDLNYSTLVEDYINNYINKKYMK